MNEITKPITIIKQEFTDTIIKHINDSTLPLFVIEYILRDILNETHMLSQKQLEVDMEKYKEQLEKLNSNTDEQLSQK